MTLEDALQGIPINPDLLRVDQTRTNSIRAYLLFGVESVHTADGVAGEPLPLSPVSLLAL